MRCQNLVNSKKVPGLSITVIQNGKIRFQNGYGYSNLEEKSKVDVTNTVFRIASISKCITGLALAKMAEEGILNFDDSVYTYLPDYPKKGFDVTLRQLAGHTAGIRAYRGKEYALNKNLTIKDSLSLFQDDPLQFNPGEGYLYNSFDFVLLSRVMEVASGIPFDIYVKENVLEPIGLKCTFTPEEIRSKTVDFSTKALELASFHTKTRNGFKEAVAVNNQYKLAGGGYLSTSMDVAKLGHYIMEKQNTENPFLKEILKSQNVNGNPTFYGMGFQVSQDKAGRRFFGHVGNSVGAYSNFFCYPKTETVISILVNCTDPKIQLELDEMVNCILAEK